MKNDELVKLVLMGLAVVEDFLPNIGNCTLQDFGRLNDFLIAAHKLQREQADRGEV